VSIQRPSKKSAPLDGSWKTKVVVPRFRAAPPKNQNRQYSRAVISELCNRSGAKGQEVDAPIKGTADSESSDGTFAIFHPSLAERLRLVAAWGDFSLAWSIGVQEGLSYFGNRHAMLGFAKKWGNVYVLADPLGPPEVIGQLLDAFLQIYPKACFVQCQKTTAAMLEERGFYINEMGVDTHLDLTEYNFSGKQKESFRYAANWLKRRGFRVVEDQTTESSRQAAADISTAWRATRTVKRREVAFLNRPLDLDQEWNRTETTDRVRKFYLADANDKPVAFVFFDPIFEFEKVIGYVTSFKRRQPDAPANAELGITKHAIEIFQSENIRSLNLGLSPLAEIENLDFRKNPFLHFTFRYLYGSSLFNRFVYSLKGHAEFKQKFRGETEKVYFASRTIVNDLRLFGLLKLCRVI
jgi:phosphatidylglycerol lysyltransferase